MLTLVVDTKMNTTKPVIICYCGKVSRRVRFRPQLANSPLIPASAFTVATLLDDGTGIKVVHANLPTCLSDRVPEMR